MRALLLAGLLLATPAPALAQPADLPRTPWGAPDLGGYWEYRSTTPLERPEALAGREVLTAAEEAEYLAGRHAAIRRERDLQLNADWWQPGGLTDGPDVADRRPARRPPAAAHAGRPRAGAHARHRHPVAVGRRAGGPRALRALHHGTHGPAAGRVPQPDSRRSSRRPTTSPSCTSRTPTCASSRWTAGRGFRRGSASGRAAPAAAGRVIRSSSRRRASTASGQSGAPGRTPATSSASGSPPPTRCTTSSRRTTPRRSPDPGP